jgi:AcrR family transcriptional regulator
LEERLLAAAWSLLQESGYDGLKLNQVAVAAGAHRSDLYRRWSSKAMLVTDVLDAFLPPTSDVDHGTLLADVQANLEQLAASWSAPWIDGLIGLAADLRTDPDAELAFQALAKRRGEPMRKAFARAAERGEVADPAALSAAADFMEGALMHRRIIARQPLTPQFLDTVAQLAHRILTHEHPDRSTVTS